MPLVMGYDFWVDELTRSLAQPRFEQYKFDRQVAEKVVALMRHCPAALWEWEPAYFSYLVCTNRNSVAFCAYLAGEQPIDARVIVTNVLEHYWKHINPVVVTDLTSLITALRQSIATNAYFASLFEGEPTDEEVLAMFMVDALISSDDVGGGYPFDYTLKVDLPLRAGT